MIFVLSHNNFLGDISLGHNNCLGHSVIKRWSNSKVQLRQQRVPIISIEIIETTDERELQKNNKRKTIKDRKEQGE